MLEVILKGTSAFRYLDVQLSPGDTIITEAGAMASMSPGLDLKAKFNGGIVTGAVRKFLGGESLFINEFTNNTQDTQRVVLTASAPGDISVVHLNNESICLEPGAYICSTPGLSMGVRYAGISSFIAREGLFKLEVSGTGSLWFGGYGQIVEKQLDGEYIVDSGHLLAYSPEMRLNLQLSNGIIGSFLGGEGFVTKVRGKGKLYLQSRSIDGLAGWLNRKL